MAVKFVRTCDRCGKVIREGNANSTLTVGEGNSLNFYTKDEHKSYDICDECAEAFVKFINSAAVKPIGIVDFYSKEYKMRRTIEDVHEHFGVARPENKHNPHAWSDEVLSLCPEAKEGYDADAVKKTLEEYDADGRVSNNGYHKHKWTEEEDMFLIEERRRKVKTPKMAEKLGLTISQVRSRIKYLDKLRKKEGKCKNESGGVVFGLDGTVYTQDKDKLGWTGYSNEVLEMARKHNENCEEPKTDSEPITQTPNKDKTKIKLAPGTHTYHHWTASEDRAILKAGKTLNDLACQFGTTIAAVRARKNLILIGKVDVHRED